MSEREHVASRGAAKAYQPLQPVSEEEYKRRRALLELYGLKPETGQVMAQAMLGLKTFATEKGDAHRTMEEEEEDIDGESLGSQDSVLEGETEDEMEKAELVEKETNIQSKKKSNHPMSQKRKDTMLGNFLLPSPARPASTRSSSRKSAIKKVREIASAETDETLAIRSDILHTLVAIDQYAREHPGRKIAIRNRTRESITRQLHYEKNEDRLTRLQQDAHKLLDLWSSAN
ncbi:protein 33K.1 putative variant 1 [Pigeon adenovirus 2]|uniref:Protein 33K.1 putative variant 1 n=1 Tax=Pigeon adenovirus 2 TaxID=1907767 RepID=A0A1D8QMA1_9ADEN|nr:protein 33K.1 putative variant 1 [Pigeon adenovirus 2]AOW42073.1 protein 33K.1 putative variant 1 [Pigeon adenovirus 2]